MRESLVEDFGEDFGIPGGSRGDGDWEKRTLTKMSAGMPPICCPFGHIFSQPTFRN